MNSNLRISFIASLLSLALVNSAIAADPIFYDARAIDWRSNVEDDQRKTRNRSPHAPSEYRLPAEFERQSALLIACHDLITTAPYVLVELVNATRNRVEIIALVSEPQEHRAAVRLLRAHRVSDRHVHFVELNHDTMWARDYGPAIVQSKGGEAVIIDADYDPARANDDHVPMHLAKLLNLNLVRVPLRLDGGNLISNGSGLALTTDRLVDENSHYSVTELCDAIQQGYGVKQLAILQPLVGEETGHVDMFAVFVSENTVVVGQCDPAIDPVNAEILNRNANFLATLQTERGTLRVVRIPMPYHEDGVWRTYTNVVFANGVLLVPTYADYPIEQQTAITTFAKLLPNWSIVSVDASRIIESNGALRCITMNLGPITRFPDFPRPFSNPRHGIDFAHDHPYVYTQVNENKRVSVVTIPSVISPIPPRPPTYVGDALYLHSR